MGTFKTTKLAALSLILTSPLALASQEPSVDEEGLQLVQDSRLQTVYVHPDITLEGYNKVWLEQATVSFKQNWQRGKNRSYAHTVSDDDMQRIKSDMARVFNEVFTQELAEAGYTLVNEAGPSVLRVEPAIVELDIAAPEMNRSPGRSYDLSKTYGEMTLDVSLYDSITGDRIARATDRKRDNRRGYKVYNTRDYNAATARRLMGGWAKALREALDEANASIKG